MPSFDTVSEVDTVEVRNAVDQTSKEVATRYDFKGTSASLELKEKVITLHGDAEFQIQQIMDILLGKLAKRGIDVRCLEYGDVKQVGGNKATQTVTVKEGIETELAKKIVKLIKDAKLKVQASIQGDVVRVTGKNRDDLQTAIAHLRKSFSDTPLTYTNFRD